MEPCGRIALESDWVVDGTGILDCFWRDNFFLVKDVSVVKVSEAFAKINARTWSKSRRVE